MKKEDETYEIIKKLCIEYYIKNDKIKGFSAGEISELTNAQRTNTSSILNKLYSEGKLEKIPGKPVLYKVKDNEIKGDANNAGLKIKKDIFDNIIGAELGLKKVLQQARAAIIYPPNGLHTLILGETGTGKSMFAEIMYKYAKQIGKIKANAPFVAFNCADYSNNPQLLMSQIFGVRKGAYTGATKDRIGLVETANEGILFLDEVHRLPPEGQEMLFYLIDKGVYRRLGENEKDNKVNVLIICATTENVESTLLKTFTRRIPMIITLPSLEERSLEERYELLESFFKVEANSIKKHISVTANSLRALLLYNCSNNIGQLKSDIKLCCSKAFLNHMMEHDEKICIHSHDLPQYIMKGLLRYKEKRSEVDKFVNKNEMKFYPDDSKVVDEDSHRTADFYEELEEKREILESKGISEKDIKLIMSLDIDTYFRKYMLNVNKEGLTELYKVVDEKIVKLVNKFIGIASERLGIQLDAKILYGLSMHISSTIERVKNGKKIHNNQLEEIKRMYSEEYNIGLELKNAVEYEFGITIPEDEVGFITMFLCLDRELSETGGKVGIILAMHGESAATSIADVVNRLLGENYAIGYNMPLEQKPELALESITKLVEKNNQGKGILLLVDMGSLVLFGDMIYEKTKIPVKTIEMVSTPIVLEATRKALLNATLEEVYESCLNISPYVGRIYTDSFSISSEIKKNIIITACITGKGTAVKLKSIVEQKLDVKQRNIDVITMDIDDKHKFNEKIRKIKQHKNIIAVVSSFKPEDDSILYISTSEIFHKEKFLELKSIITSMETIENMRDVISQNVSIDADKYIENFKKFYMCLCDNQVELNDSTLVGLILHLACAVERILENKEVTNSTGDDIFINNNRQRYEIIKKIIKPMEEELHITMPQEEYISILKIIYFL